MNVLHINIEYIFTFKSHHHIIGLTLECGGAGPRGGGESLPVESLSVTGGWQQRCGCEGQSGRSWVVYTRCAQA